MSNIIVYIVYDPLYEKVCSVHKQEASAIRRAISLDNKDQRKINYLHEYDLFELEE